ncbi:hypothetical protein VZ94_05640 [Methylocucumis oryzae]|uniref:Uncharacterized protein n=2 Tax=Methylocucumis oryzae TaxID=1632867 RepID=A0A0F3IP05_9GAMM|nr:hypothetical protein VZ94_05640 [Methylocucumis oryzae]
MALNLLLASLNQHLAASAVGITTELNFTNRGTMKMKQSIKQLSSILAVSAVLAFSAITPAEAAPKTFKDGVLTFDFAPDVWGVIMSRAGNAYNGVDSNGRPNDEHWQQDTSGTNNMVFDNGLKGIIEGDAYNTRDLYLDDYFTAEEIAPLTAYQVIGQSKRLGASTLAFNLIYLHNFNPLLTDDAVNLVGIHRLPFSEPWPKPPFKVFPYGVTPTKSANDNGGRNPQATTAMFDDFDPLATFTGQIGLGGAFRMFGRWGQVSVGDLALRYDPLRSTVNAYDRTTGLPLGGKEGTDGWYFTAHMNLTSELGLKGTPAFETADTKVKITGDKFVLTGNIVLTPFWRGKEGPNGVRKAGTFRLVAKLMPAP